MDSVIKVMSNEDKIKICGLSLVKTVSELKVLEANIGELGKSDIKKDIYDLELCGIEYDACGVGKIYKKRGGDGVSVKKFFRTTDYTPIKSIVKYLSDNVLNAEQTEAIEYLIDSVNSSSAVFVPLNLGAEVRIIDGGKQTNGVVNGISWKVDKETMELKGKIRVKEALTQKIKFKPFSEYGKTIEIRNMYYTLTNKEEQLIKLTDCGLVKPIEFRDKNGNVIIIDNYGAFRKDENGEELIGIWNGSNGLTGLKQLECRELREVIEENEMKLLSHRHIIGPHGLFETNKITV